MQSRLAAMAKEQANTDSIRDYYGGASAFIQDEQPAKHEAVKHHDLCESTPASIEKLVAAASFVDRLSQMRDGPPAYCAGLRLFLKASPPLQVV